MKHFDGDSEIEPELVQEYLASLCLAPHRCSQICYCWELRKVPGIAAEILRAGPPASRMDS